MPKKVDYLIIGQGIAGTCFAFKLLREKKSFLIVDRGIEKSASSVAAGLINPVALRRLVLSWRAHDFLNYNHGFYKDIALLLGRNYHHTLPIEKLISSDDEIFFWNNKLKDPMLSEFLGNSLSATNAQYLQKDVLKIGRVEQASRVDISLLIKDFRSYLKKNNLIIEEDFDSKDLSKHYVFRGYSFKHIVFCEGARGIKNPFFNNFPFSLNKGQNITIKSHDIGINSILKKQVFIMPTAQVNLFKVGATYSWKWDNDLPEKEKTIYLEQRISEMLSIRYTIEKEEVGIRPASRDRRPLLGESSIRENYYIFNGLGSKGCLMAPLMAEELYNHIETGSPLSPETNIARYDN